MNGEWKRRARLFGRDVFGNKPRHEPETERAFEEVYARHAPEMSRPAVPGAAEAQESAEEGAIRATGAFSEPEWRRYDWERRYTERQWLDQLGTHSDHLLLPPDRLRALLNGIGRAITGLGGTIVVYFRTDLLMASRCP